MDRHILIQGAMEEETSILISALQNPKEITLGVWSYVVGTIDDYPVVISRTRIGMTNAAASTVLAVEHFKPIAIINQGTAGGHDPELHKGDLVLAKEVLNISAFETEFKKEGEGIDPITWSFRGLEVLDKHTSNWIFRKNFKCNDELFNIATSLKSTFREGKVIEGIIGSGDIWNKEIDRILWHNKTIKTSAEEMEAASVAQIADNYNIPFLCIRILSNNEIHHEDFDPSTGGACQEYTLDVVKEYIKVLKQK